MCRVVTYTREEGDMAPIDVRRVEEMIFQRSQHRQDRNFATADAIQDELTQMGVTVFDRERKWFVGRGSGRQLQYCREVGDVKPVDVGAVEALIEERNARRKSRDWDGADRVRDRLKNEHGVFLKDKELKWYVGAGARGGSGADRRGDFERPRPGSGVDRRDGFERPRQRRAPPRDRGYGNFDGGEYDPSMTRMERRQYGKRERQWAAKSMKATAYVCCADDTSTARLEAATVAEIQSKVDARLSAKLARRYDEADALLAELGQMGVALSDDRRMWRADGVRFLNTYHEEGDPSGDTPDWIAAAIAKRGAAKAESDFATADAILARLEAEGIGVDDARRTWRYLPAPAAGYAPPPETDLDWSETDDDGW